MTNTEIAAPVDPRWGEMYGCSPDAPDYLTCPDRRAVWMYRKGQRVRFYDANANMIGPEHKNVAPAVVWAAANSWWNCALSGSMNVALYTEVRENTTYRRRNPEAEAGAWDPNAPLSVVPEIV